VHWADVAAGRLLERGRKHHVASGTSISGLIHIGNAGDVIYADGVARALREKGAEAQVIWVADDVDPLRALPEQIPPSFSEYLGRPVFTLPDPSGCHGSFPDHVIEPFLASLADLGIKPVEKRGSRMYADGEYDEAVKVAFARAEAIREILVSVAHSKKEKGWLPFDPICERCGKIATTDALGLEGGKVRYRCGGGVAGKKEMVGCGNEGAVAPRHGKLTWRVEWAARWQILGVTCEPFGKEHSAAGGSYDTSKVISKEVFGYEPPLPLLYEYILVRGAKMAKSKGNVFPLSALLEVLPPEVVRFFFFRVEPNKHRDFDPATKLLPLAEEYERAQAIVGGRVPPSPREDADDLSRACVLSEVDGARPAPPDLVPFGHLVTLAQVVGDDEGVLRALHRSNYKIPPDGPESERLRRRATLARRLSERYVPAEERFAIVPRTDGLPLGLLDSRAQQYLAALSGNLDCGKWSPEEIHNAVFNTARAAGVEPQDAFRAVYLSLIGKDRGPRAGFFLSSLDCDFVIRRFKDVSQAK